MEDIPRELRLLVIGKTGHGKSSVCNTILEQPGYFSTGTSMSESPTTRTAQTGFVRHMDRPHPQEQAIPPSETHIHVVDTPDVINREMNFYDQEAEVSKWRHLTVPRPSAVLLVVRCDVRYNKKDYALYKEIVRLWNDDSVKDILIVVFTFGDRLGQDIESVLTEAPDTLNSVLNNANRRYVVFNNEASEEEKERFVEELLEKVQMIEQPGGVSGLRILGILGGIVVVVAAAVVLKKPAVARCVAVCLAGLALLHKFVTERNS